MLIQKKEFRVLLGFTAVTMIYGWAISVLSLFSLFGLIVIIAEGFAFHVTLNYFLLRIKELEFKLNEGED